MANSIFERKLLPELERFPDAQSAENALKSAKRKRSWIALILIFILLIVMGVGLRQFVIDRFLPAGMLRDIVVKALLLSALTSASGYLGIRLWVAPIRYELRQMLVERGIPICIPCGYDLQGQQIPRCPECGAPFAPDLLTQPAEPEH